MDNVVINYIDEAVAKLQGELNTENKKSNDYRNKHAICDYLIERVKESESLAKDICQEHKTLSKSYEYVYDRARKYAEGARGVMIDNDTVFEWVEDYYHLDDKAEEEKKAKEEEERKKKAAEKKQEKEEAVPKPKKVENKPKVEKAWGVGTKEEPKKEKKNSNNNLLEGQMDFFSYLGG